MKRGVTLIELMVALSILSAGVLIFFQLQNYQRASTRAAALEGLSRVIDMELERASACGRRACLEKLVTQTATTAGLSSAQNTWTRAHVQRSIEDGPNNTVLVKIRAEVPGVVSSRSASTLVKVK